MTQSFSAGQVHLEERRELARLFLRQASHGFLAGVMMCLLVASQLLYQNGILRAWLWAAIMCGLSGATLLSMRRQRCRVDAMSLDDIDRMEWRYAMLHAAVGLCWGVLPWTMFGGLAQEWTYIAITMALAVGISSAASAMLAPLPKTGPAFVIATLLPYTVKLFQSGESIYFTAAVVALGGIVAIVLLGHTYYRTIATAVRLQLENVALVEEVRAEKQAVEEASRIKSLFLAGVSHDLKHPLNALGLYLGYLKTRRTEGEAAAGVARTLPGMEEALGGMGNLLSRLLELSRLEAGEYQPRREAVELGSLLQRCAAQFADKAGAKGLRFSCVPTRTRLIGDITLLQSILDNLVGNAIRYTERGGVVAGVRRCNGRLMIQVVDSGPGIPAERIPLLFEAYRRFNDTQRSQEGYGLGLALVKKQCELAGYTIKVESVLGKGSVFSIQLESA